MKEAIVRPIAQGTYFDLNRIFRELNARFFDDGIRATLRWGKNKRTDGFIKRSIRLGSYNPKSSLITIHPCLDQAIVPLICVERIVFHEMLHQHLPPRRSSKGRTLYHHADFNRFEDGYPYRAEADLWFKINLARLLRY